MPTACPQRGSTPLSGTISDSSGMVCIVAEGEFVAGIRWPMADRKLKLHPVTYGRADRVLRHLGV